MMASSAARVRQEVFIFVLFVEDFEGQDSGLRAHGFIRMTPALALCLSGLASCELDARWHQWAESALVHLTRLGVRGRRDRTP